MAPVNLNGWFAADWPAPPQVRAVTTTRHGGVSTGNYASFNLAMHVNDNPLAVQRNRQRLRDMLDLPGEPVWLNQVHGNTVVAAHACMTVVKADASYTDHPRVVCAVLTADCLPVLFTDRRGRQVAAAHAGWRGLHNGVISAALASFSVPREDILVWLGPAIGPNAFEVRADVYEAFVQRDAQYRQAFTEIKAEHWYFDVYQAARLELAQAGVTHVYGGERCTFSEAKSFYSYRREHTTGRMASLIWLSP